MSALHVGVDARLLSGQLGGVEQTIIGLAHGFSQLDDGDEIYHFLLHPGADGWLLPHLQGRCRPLYTQQPVTAGAASSWRGKARSWLRRGWHSLAPLLGESAVPVPSSDGVIERAGIDVMHFAAPLAFLTETPSLYQFFDVQHRVLPGNFTAYERMARDVQYQRFMGQAQIVSAMTSHGKEDLLQHYPQITADKVVVVPFGPAVTAYAPLSSPVQAEIEARLALPERYLFYPAQTWPHKNHLNLLDALARLRHEKKLTVPLICSGRRNDFFATIERKLHALDLTQQVRFLGFVSPDELQVLYQRCHAVIYPSRFEGFGLPVLEAFQCQRPLACANIPLLADMAGDAALFFDPADPGSIAQAICQLWQETTLLQRLQERAAARLGVFDWERTARTFRALHRRLAGRSLTGEDEGLIAAPPVV